ncbi:MAG: WYL domain-containing protein [Myxococcales bacterium]|nr:WYL domain-containing protein [Myxococcales bacterium]
MPIKPSKGKGDAPKGGKGDDAGSRGDRSKRLLDLVMILLGARTPVTYREIREQFTAYQTLNVEAGLRAFERDKADLLELGVPIRYITPDEDDSLEDGGYVIDLKRFRLPEVRLTADEVSALVLAASVARAIPGGTYPKIVDLALKKLAFDLPELPDTPTVFPRPAPPTPVLVHFPERRTIGVDRPELGEIYATLESATRLRKRVTLKYQAAATGSTSRRDVDPYGLVYRESAWYLVGWCHLRREIRSFRVDRIGEATMAPKPKSPDFERPTGFDVRAFVNRSPWTFTTEPVESVTLELSALAADTANEDFGPAAVKRHRRGRLRSVPLRQPRVRRVPDPGGQGRDRRARRPASARLADELAAIAATTGGARCVTSPRSCGGCCSWCRTWPSTRRASRSTSWPRSWASIATRCWPTSSC